MIVYTVFNIFCTLMFDVSVLFCLISVARHLYGYMKVLDGDGDPDRPDNYAPLEVAEQQV